MGAKNHQPCNQYLPDSVKLSRSLSLARVEMEMANIHLEDLLLNELEGRHGELRNIICSIDNSILAFRSSLKAINDLRSRMVDADYHDLPTLNTLDLKSIGHRLSSENVVNQNAWDEVVKVMRSTGFYSVLENFEHNIERLIEDLLILNQKVTQASDVVMDGQIGEMLEENKSGNFKKQFAKLFSELTTFEQYFLASSILSTELWYAFNGFGSLTGISVRMAAA